MLEVTYVDRFFPEAIRFFRGRPLQKKYRRKIQGLAKPIPCPKCRMRTRQVEEHGVRTCLSCGSEFTNWGSRKGVVLESV